jgi:uncharacterized membrane protein (UPF0127 family)
LAERPAFVNGLEATFARIKRPKRRAWRARFRATAAGLALVVATAVPVLSGCRSDGPAVVLHGTEGSTRVSVELALTRDEQAHGLMWRNELDANAGMLFVFKREEDRSFWMKNTPLPLDIIYIDADSKVVSVAANTVPYSQTSLPSEGPAKYVLEVNAGYAKKHGIGPGTRVELPAQASDGAKSDG